MRSEKITSDEKFVFESLNDTDGVTKCGCCVLYFDGDPSEDVNEATAEASHGLVTGVEDYICGARNSFVCG